MPEEISEDHYSQKIKTSELIRELSLDLVRLRGRAGAWKRDTIAITECSSLLISDVCLVH